MGNSSLKGLDASLDPFDPSQLKVRLQETACVEDQGLSAPFAFLKNSFVSTLFPLKTKGATLSQASSSTVERDVQASRQREIYLSRLGIYKGSSSCTPRLHRARHYPGEWAGAEAVQWADSCRLVRRVALSTAVQVRDAPCDAPVQWRRAVTDESMCDVETMSEQAQSPRAQSEDSTTASQRSRISSMDWDSSKEDFRVNFLRKLSYRQVWVPQIRRPPRHQTVIIFDWDDTLLCTSFLAGCFNHDSLEMQRRLREIASVTKKLLTQAQSLGNTFIITNSMRGWVEYSAAKYCPSLLPVLQGVRVISARAHWEAYFPGEVEQWKLQAFLDVQRQFDHDAITNLVSLGDSMFEIDAAHIMGQEFGHATVKTIKFRESPSPQELLGELDLVAQRFVGIVESGCNMKVTLDRKFGTCPVAHRDARAEAKTRKEDKRQH
eukprot:gnl/TRDRNA2_/TRDRNA2_189366_c0_seq1.p1 gnl/TRDRNA2_/TRDRNA2_189366_c0~~gnl/TRDRNA2_/TRDRNA2_189366_c0_seq1.p1  ORF type:complete len:435 (-),score=54.64 gnl/TRDRNA2_/TRDRNA2_189366_c0_seq1:2-1306(-)